MTLTASIIFLLLLVIIELLYFRVAHQFGIVDRPNHRTMHDGEIIRGGGIIFFVAIVLLALWYQNVEWPFLVGISLLFIISFLDDIRDVPSWLRSIIQITAITLIVWESGVFSLNVTLGILAVIIFTGVLNAYNFMDGINGITGGYSLVLIASLLLINSFFVLFINKELLYATGLALLIFNFFNFRNNARCFAGDVGSVTIAFIIIYAILQMMMTTGSPIWILLLSLYGVDSVITIIERILLKENIFQPHKRHIFQVGVYKGGLSHLQMSAIFMVLQLVHNLLIVWSVFSSSSPQFQYLISFSILLFYVFLYVFIKFKVLGVKLA